MTVRIIIGILIFFLGACSHPNQEKIDRDFIKLSLKEIQRIPVNHDPKSFMFGLYGKDLWVVSSDHNIFKRFFIQSDGTLSLSMEKELPAGKGPGEIYECGSFQIDSKGHLVIMENKQSKVLVFDENLNYLDTTYLNDLQGGLMSGYQSSALFEDRYSIHAVVPVGEAAHEFFAFDYQEGRIVKTFGRKVAVDDTTSAHRALDGLIPIMGVFSQCGKTLFRMTFEPMIYLYRDFKHMKTLDLNDLFSEYGYVFTPPVKGKIKSSPGYISDYYMNVNKSRKEPYLCFYDSAGNRLLLTVFDESGNICKKYRIQGAHFTFYGEEGEKDILVYWYDNVLVFRKGKELILYKILEGLQ